VFDHPRLTGLFKIYLFHQKTLLHQPLQLQSLGELHTQNLSMSMSSSEKE